MINENFVFLGALFSLIGTVIYVRDIYAGRVKPNLVTWVLWAVAPLIAFAAQLSEGAGLRSVLAFTAGFGPLLIVIVSLLNRSSIFKTKKSDYYFGALSVTGIILWIITGEGIVAIVFAILADFFAAVPTIEKLYKHPETENGAIFGFGIIAATISLMTVTDWRFEEYGFSLYILLICMLMFLPTLIRWVTKKPIERMA
jgi:hypothetical protein